MPTKLGQNFLKDESVVKKIIESANLQPTDFVVEIGPGQGVLTEELAKKAGKVLAIEIDRNLIPALENKFKAAKNIEIIHADILNIDLQEIVETPRRGVSTSGYRVIANIPYYITSKIIRLFLESGTPPREMILMVQKEVAERIVAMPGQMSILAVSVQYYADAEILFEVSKSSFDPVPEVDSAVIKIVLHNSPLPVRERMAKGQERVRPEEDSVATKKFFKIVKAGFSAKRKTLINNLSNGLHLDKNIVEEKIKTAGLKPTVRAQELSIADWERLARLFS